MVRFCGSAVRLGPWRYAGVLTQRWPLILEMQMKKSHRGMTLAALFLGRRMALVYDYLVGYFENGCCRWAYMALLAAIKFRVGQESSGDYRGV